MRIDYSREALSKDMSGEGQMLWGQVRNFEKRAYNRTVVCSFFEVPYLAPQHLTFATHIFT